MRFFHRGWEGEGVALPASGGPRAARAVCTWAGETGVQTAKRELKQPLSEDMIISVKNPQNPLRKPLEERTELGKIQDVRYQSYSSEYQQ